MTIKDVEERTGLSRSNIRFYEKEKLIEPSRNESNGYRDYSENDVENIKKIAYLRTLPCLTFQLTSLFMRTEGRGQALAESTLMFF